MYSFAYRRSPQLAQYLEERIDGPFSVATVVPDGLPLVLEGSSLLIFERIEAAPSGAWKSAAEISGEIAAALELDVAEVHGSVAAFLATLNDTGLVQRRKHPDLP